MAKKRRHRRQRSRIRIPKRPVGDAPPGTISPPVDAPKPKLHAMMYGAETLEEVELETTAGLTSLRGRAPVVWLNIDGVGDATVIKEVGEAFGLHPLALEDVVNLHQRPKAEEYDEHVYIVIKMPTVGDTFALEQVSLFLGEGYVITVQERSGDCLDPLRERIRKSGGRIRRSGADYLAYAVIDTIFDDYYPVVEGFNEQLEALEGQILRSPDQESVGEVHAIRHDLHVLRRVLASSRAAIALLAHGETGPVTEETSVFFRDCQDHTSQLLDGVEACRDLSGGLLELHLSGVSHRMNEVMKVLTLIATIFIPLTFIAGVYGMNFDPTTAPWSMPELGWSFGYPFALALMAVTALGFIYFFRRRGWLGELRRPDQNSHDRD